MLVFNGTDPADVAAPGTEQERAKNTPNKRNGDLSGSVFPLMRTALVVLVLLLFLSLAAGLAFDAWVALDAVEMNWHGYTAMVLGIIFSLALGFGLMGLMFYSSRHGYDEPPDRQKPER